MFPGFDNEKVGEHRLDLVVADRIILELKATASFSSEHFATVRSYLKASGYKIGLLLNFGRTRLQVKRVTPVIG